MPPCSNLHYLVKGNKLIVKTIQQVRLFGRATPLAILCCFLVLLMALALAVPALHAQEWDHINGRDKAHDPTGTWLIRNSEGQFILTVFHKGRTLTGDIQGENAFDPSATKPPMPPRTCKKLLRAACGNDKLENVRGHVSDDRVPS